MLIFKTGKKWLLLLGLTILTSMVFGWWLIQEQTPQSTTAHETISTPHKTVAANQAKPVSAKPIVKEEIEEIKEVKEVPFVFRWDANARQTYRYNLNVDIKINTEVADDAKNWQHIQLDLQGILNMRLFRQEGDLVHIGFQLSSLQITQGGQRIPIMETLYQTFFMASFTLEGKPVEFYLPNYMQPAERIPLTEIINSVQIVLPPTDKIRPTEWKTEEIHGTGHYQASYSLQKGIIHKQKIAYTKITPLTQKTSFQLNGKVISSSWQATLSSKQAWLNSVTGEEKLKIATKHNKISEAIYRASLKISNDPQNPNLDIWQANNDPKKVIQALADMKTLQTDTAWEQMKQLQLREKYAHFQLGNITSQLDKLNVDDVPLVDKIDYINDLENYLSAYPEATTELVALLKTEVYSAATVSTLVHVLGIVGHTEAQQALATLMIEGSTTNKSVMEQAIITSGISIQQPEALLVDALWQKVHDSSEHTGTTLLALGTSSYHLGENGDEYSATQVRDDLITFLQNDANTGKTVVLKALANTGSTEIFEAIEPYLAAEKSRVRAAAHQVLGSFEDDTSRAILLDTIASDKSATVRKEALRAITKRIDKDEPEVITSLGQTLAKEPDKRLRKEMVRFLGEHSSNPEVETILQQQLKQEESRNIKKEIYRALHTENQ